MLIGLPLAGKPSWWYVRVGDSYFDTKEWDAAIAQYTEAIRVKPDYSVAYFKRGLCYRKKSDIALAASDFASCLQYDSDHLSLDKAADTPYFRVLSANAKSDFYMQNDCEMPIAIWTEAVKRRQDGEWLEQLALAHYHRSVSLLNKQRYDQAILDCSLAIQAKPNARYAYHIRGVAYRDKGDLEAAIRDLTQALGLAPTSDALADRGEAYRRSGKLDDAIADCDRAIQTDPKNAFAYQVRGLARDQKGENRKANEDFAEAKRLGYTSK